MPRGDGLFAGSRKAKKLDLTLQIEELAPASIEEVLRLPSFLETLREIERMHDRPFAALSLAEQDSVILLRLKQIVNIASLNPCWRDRLMAAGVSQGIRSFDEWQEIPITDKEAFGDLFTGARPGLVVPLDHCGFEIVASGGTTSGRPSETVYSLKELWDTYEFAGEFIGRHLIPRYLGHSGPKWVATTLADYQMWSSGTMVGGVLQRIPGVNYVGAGPMSREVYHHMMRYPGPKAIMGISQSIALLADFAEGLEEEARQSFRAALYGSGLLSVKVENDLRAVYPNLSILSYFAATQAETIGLQLADDSKTLCEVPGLHLVEIVDECGRWVGEGEEGELVVTRLHATEAPVLRYKVGDRFLRRSDLVTEELSTRQFEFNGRSGDFLHIGDTQYSARRALQSIFKQFSTLNINDLESIAHTIQFVNNRRTKELYLILSVDSQREVRTAIAGKLGPEGSAPLIMRGLIASLSLFNSLEANEASLYKAGYKYGLKVVDRQSNEIVRSEVGKIPLVVDRL
jgi:phenylacetate-CoA ligase